MVKILTAITVDGLDAVESAAAEALAGGVASADVVINILARSRSAPVEPSIATPDHLQLHIEPSADAGRRSDEHTSELQSLMRISYAVFCLKQKKITHPTPLSGETLAM